MAELPAKRVLVLGGGGFYGRYLVNDLLRFTDAEIVVASRTPPTAWPQEPRVSLARCDVSDAAALDRVVAGVDVVVHCAGPFHTLPLGPLHAALRAGVPYVDIAEDRAFLHAVHDLEAARQSSGAVMSGLSVSPGMEALFGQRLATRFDRMTSLRTFAAPDTRKHRGPAMFNTMLTGVGAAFQQPRDGTMRTVHGWTEGEWVEFPPPVGKRLTYLVLEMANLDLIPALLGVGTVEFKAGTEWPSLNRMLNAAARIRAATGHPAWERMTPLVRGFSWLVGRVGKDEGGVIFEGTGLVNGETQRHRIALMGERDGGLIPSVLAAIAVARLLTGELQAQGLVPLDGWIAPGSLLRELTRRSLAVWEWPHGVAGWQRGE